MMCLRCVSLMASIIAARVVDLPQPVGPVTTTKPRGLAMKLADYLGQAELLESRDLDGDEAKHGTQAVALEVGVDSETGAARQRIGEVDLEVVFEMLALLLSKQAVDQLGGLRGVQSRKVKGLKLTVDAYDRWRADRDVQVTCIALEYLEKKFGDVHAAASRVASQG